MELENIQNRIREIDNEIKYLNSQKAKLENNIEEAEQAAATAKKARKEFDDFVSRRRAAKNKPVKQSLLKSFKSFVNRANALLSGGEYSSASSKVDELATVISNKIKHYTNDLDYCKREIRRLKNEKASLSADYNNLLAQQNQEGEK
ncbi:MAG: hypothetical protein IIW94_03330 [Clostridia bacterium]|nr:hypothetical protein [Clostridia bacterium]